MPGVFSHVLLVLKKGIYWWKRASIVQTLDAVRFGPQTVVDGIETRSVSIHEFTFSITSVVNNTNYMSCLSQHDACNDRIIRVSQTMLSYCYVHGCSLFWYGYYYIWKEKLNFHYWRWDDEVYDIVCIHLRRENMYRATQIRQVSCLRRGFEPGSEVKGVACPDPCNASLNYFRK